MVPVNPDEDFLIAECLAGDPAAFGALVTRYQDRLYHSVYRLLHNHEDAHDVVQDAFLSAYESLSSFHGNARFFTWLYRIAFNTAITMKRKQRMIQRRTPTADGPVEPPDSSLDSRPEARMESVEEERMIQAGLDRLSAEHRAVLVMKDLDGMKYEEMAEILQVPIGTVRSRLHRARLELREILVQAETKKK